MDDDDAVDDDDAFQGTVASPSPSPLRRSPPPPPPTLQSQKRPPSPVKKKACHRKTKPPPEKLPYEKSEEESKAVAQKDLDNWWKSLVESKARRLELQKNPPKPHYIAQRELRKRVSEVEKKRHEAHNSRHYRTMNALSTSHIRHR